MYIICDYTNNIQLLAILFTKFVKIYVPIVIINSMML